MKNYHSLFLVITLLFFLLYADHLIAQNKVDSLNFKMDAIFKKYNNTSGPGCAVAIIKNGKVIFEKGYGMANLEYGKPLIVNSVFDIGSLAKQFTSLAISILIQEGEISLTDNINQAIAVQPLSAQPRRGF